ncbi:MAG: ABC transporter permease [Phaeodactylibacter sp.]|nr:ABC transporter permease [Phaeodactylibacter sp.]MCB9052155.1 ABC transporter permease [Lewinellaceae bacterium]
MIKDYLRIAFRSLLKHRFYSLINIFGLAIGMAVFLLIALYIRFERSYEDFIPNAENIYRVALEQYLNGELQIASAENYPGVGPALLDELPEVTAYARLYNLGYKNNVIITNEEAWPEPVAFKHRKFLYADSSFLPMMGYEMVAGDLTTALAEPLTAVISEKYAELYFGRENPVGKSLHLQDDDYNDELVKVTGVFKNLPHNTHLKFDVLFSYKTLYGRFDRAPERYGQSWRRKDMYTFIEVKPGTNPQALEAKFSAIVEQYRPDNQELNRKDILRLQPLRDIHLHSSLAEEPEPNGDRRIVLFMGLIGLFVLAIAWVNYVNLSTARAIERAREVGIRKVAGAVKGQLVGQFMVEAALLNLLSLLISWVLVFLALPFFNSLSGLAFDFFYLIEPWFVGLLLLLWLVGSLLSGIYPAFVLSAFRPVSVLKGSLKNTAGGIGVRKGLVVFQFAASVILIVGAFTIYRQLHYMLNRDLGMDIGQVLVIERPGISERDRDAFTSAIDVFRAELAKHPDIEAVSTSLTVPGKKREYKSAVKRYGADDNQAVTLRINSMDYDFLEVFRMKLLAGRAFSEDFPRDSDTSVILTESAVRLLGFGEMEDAIGQTLSIPAFEWNPIVAGVVNDYHQESLKKAADPTIFFCTLYSGEFYSMRLQTSRLPQTLAHVEKAWTTAFPGNPFGHFFLDDYFNRQYENERRFGKLSAFFAFLAIIIGCLGLFGLSGYTIAQRTKEIGIRKVLGASTAGIVSLLSKDILRLVLLAIVVASPLAWWAMNRWLQGFAYRIDIGWQVFVLAGVLTVAVAFITVSLQSVRAAQANPGESLRMD